jgi:hypothetical protein
MNSLQPIYEEEDDLDEITRPIEVDDEASIPPPITFLDNSSRLSFESNYSRGAV